MFKTRVDTFGNDFGHFWNFEFFSIFLKFFENPALQGTRGKKFFFDKFALKHVQNTFAHFWERFWAIMELWIFLIFWKISKTRPTMEQWAKSFFPKESPKTRLDTWEWFWTILELWNFFDFFLEFFLCVYLKV